MMDITNKAIEVSNRMQEIEHRLACKDLTVGEAEDLRYEYAELEEWNHCLNAYFKIRAENEKLKAQVEHLKVLVEIARNQYLEDNEDGETDCVTPYDDYSLSHTQCLAEIKARAVEQVFNHFKNKFNGSEKLTVRDICWMLDEHLNQLRQQVNYEKI